jgi:hypothetical protein
MKIGRIESLQDQHSRLEYEIAELANWPSADPGRIQALKRQKLRVKEQLSAAWSVYTPEARVMSGAAA